MQVRCQRLGRHQRIVPHHGLVRQREPVGLADCQIEVRGTFIRLPSCIGTNSSGRATPGYSTLYSLRSAARFCLASERKGPSMAAHSLLNFTASIARLLSPSSPAMA